MDVTWDDESALTVPFSYDTMDKDNCQDLLRAWSNLKLTYQNPADFITELEDVQPRLKSRHEIKKEDNELMLQALIAIENDVYKVDKAIFNNAPGEIPISVLKMNEGNML